MKSCFLMGHRDCGSEMYTFITDAVRKYVELYGVQEFIVGHYGRFDNMAARAVMEIKKSMLM